MGHIIKFECKCLYVDVNVTVKSKYSSYKFNTTTEGVIISVTVSNLTATIPSHGDTTKIIITVSGYARCTKYTICMNQTKR